MTSLRRSGSARHRKHVQATHYLFVCEQPRDDHRRGRYSGSSAACDASCGPRCGGGAVSCRGGSRAGGEWATALPKFQSSMALDPAVSTLIQIAKCHDHEGKLATAWAELQRALVLNGETAGAKRKKDLEAFAKGLIAALEPRVPKLTIVVRDKPAGLRLLRDGLELPKEVLGVGLPGDVGSHVIEASAPGYRTDTRNVTLVEGQPASVELTLVADTNGQAPGTLAPPGAAPAPLSAVVPTGTQATTPPESTAHSSPSWPWVVGGVGVALGGTAVALTIVSVVNQSYINDNCTSVPVTTQCQSWVSHNNIIQAAAVGAGGIGAIGIGVGIWGLVATSSRPAATRAGLWQLTPMVGPGVAGASWKGGF